VWNFATGSGYGFGGVPAGISYSMTLSQSNDSFSLHVFGTPTSGWYQTGVLNVIDSNAVSYNYHFNVKVAAITPTPHIVVNGTEHTFGDVANLNTSGLFASMPQLYLDRKDSSPLIPITNPSDIYVTTVVIDGTTTITYNSDPIYVDPTYGNIRAAVFITITDGVIAYSVSTWSEDYEGQRVAAGDVVLKSTLVAGQTSESNTLSNEAFSVFANGSPYAVFDSQSNSFDSSTGVATLTSATSDLDHLFTISFYDYTGCPTITELDDAKLAATLNVTGYVSSSSCAAYLPIFNFTDFGNQTVGDTVTWDASAKYGPYTYTVDSGSLPDGLTLNAETGAITGNPTTAGDYSFSIKANKAAAFGIQGYFGTITAIAGPAPTISFSSHTLAAGGSVDLNVSGDPADYGVCVFIGRAGYGCLPLGLTEDGTQPLDWESGYAMFGPTTVTFRLYKMSDVVDPELIDWDYPYASGDYFDIAPPNVPDAVVDLTATSMAYNSANLDWTIPKDGYSPITSYLVYQDGVLVATLDSTSLSWPQNGATTVSLQIAGLTKSTIYSFKVVAVNEMGESAAATDSATTLEKSFSASIVPSGIVGKGYSQPVTIDWGGFTGGQILTLEATAGMPAGLTFSGECSEGCSYGIAGTPTTAGTYNVTLTLTLADSSILTTNLTILIYPAEAVIRPVTKTTSVSRVVSFGGDSAMLSVSTKAALRKLVSLAKSKKMTKVSVTGYTLKTKGDKRSWRSTLGLARAKAIAKYLKTLNPKLQITVSGKGLVNKGRIATVKLQG
jgi:outer membrane protein OmpA-like peptidoglycan-associated protein